MCSPYREPTILCCCSICKSRHGGKTTQGPSAPYTHDTKTRAWFTNNGPQLTPIIPQTEPVIAPPPAWALCGRDIRSYNTAPYPGPPTPPVQLSPTSRSSLTLTLGTYPSKTFLNQITNIRSTLFCTKDHIIHCHICVSIIRPLFTRPIAVTRQFWSLHGESHWALLPWTKTGAALSRYWKLRFFLLSPKVRNPPHGDTPLFLKSKMKRTRLL